MSYINTLNKKQLSNIAELLHAMDSKCVTNVFAKAAILAVVSKESNFLPKSEIGYKNTPVGRIRKIFGSKVAHMTDLQIAEMKSSDELFFNFMYGNRYGNVEPGDGYKFRGRGPNQLTFKANYDKLAKDTGIDIVSNPDLVNNIEEGSVVCVQYFINAMNKITSELKKHYNTSGINSFQTLTDAVKCIYHANAGWGKSIAAIEKDVTSGRKKSLARAPELLIYIES